MRIPKSLLGITIHYDEHPFDCKRNGLRPPE